MDIKDLHWFGYSLRETTKGYHLTTRAGNYVVSTVRWINPRNDRLMYVTTSFHVLSMEKRGEEHGSETVAEAERTHMSMCESCVDETVGSNYNHFDEQYQ